MEYGYIYLVTDLRNNLKYVGQHKGVFDSNYLGSGLIISRLVKKYGEINFQVEPLDYAFNKQELDELEIKWIKEVNCIFPKGYNLVEGGLGGDTWTGRHHTEEAKEKNRQAHLGLKHSEETKRKRVLHRNHKINCSCSWCKAKRGEFKGQGNPMFGKSGFLGKKHTQKTKDLMRQKALGKHKSEEHKRKIKESKLKNKII